jgi:hypothetical protein
VLNSRSSRWQWLQTRIGQVFLFLGIVWSIAGAFLVLQNVLPALLAKAAALSWVSPGLTVNSELQKEAAQGCAEAERRTTADAETLQHARYAAFQMGLRFGSAAGALFSFGRRADEVAPLMQEVQDHAAALGVPKPELPELRHMATALDEFTDDLEADRQCTVASLANRYTKAHSDTYRFGAVVGYAALLCMNDVCGAHGAQIRRYGQAAGLPQDLWLPMARGSLDSVPGATAEQKTSWVLGKLIEHIRAGR